MIPRDLHHTPSMAAYKMIRLKFESACKSSIAIAKWDENLKQQISSGILQWQSVHIVKAIMKHQGLNWLWTVNTKKLQNCWLWYY